MALLTKGQRFGRIVLVEDQIFSFSEKVKGKCDCGITRQFSIKRLKEKRTQSCGCLGREKAAAVGRAKLQHPIYVGDTFGRLTVLNADKRESVVCRCECGTETLKSAYNLYKGRTNSCGCLRRDKALENVRARSVKDGLSGDPLRATWEKMIAAGVPMHEPWRQDFRTFTTEVNALLGPRPKTYSVAVIHDDLPVGPKNVMWRPRRTNLKQKTFLTPEQRMEIYELANRGVTYRRIASMYDIAPTTVTTSNRAIRRKLQQQQ